MTQLPLRWAAKGVRGIVSVHPVSCGDRSTVKHMVRDTYGATRTVHETVNEPLNRILRFGEGAHLISAACPSNLSPSATGGRNAWGECGEAAPREVTCKQQSIQWPDLDGVVRA